MSEEAHTTNPHGDICRSGDPLDAGGFEWGLLVLLAGMSIRTATRFIPPHLYRPPYTILVFLAGAASGFLKGHVGQWLDTSLENWVDTHPHFILFILVPPLLFESSFNVEFRVFWRLGPSSMLLAGPGVLLGTMMMAAALKPMLSMYTGVHDIDKDGEHDDLSFPWSAAFLVGAMVSATDPVAVTSVLGTLGAPARLSMLVEGESLLNDATAVMLFLVFQDWVIGTDITFGYLTLKTLRLTVGSVVWGVAMGTFSYYWLRHTQDITIDITLLITSVFAVFYVGEHVLHVSGILALVIYGVFLAKNKTFGMRRHLLAENHAIWEEAAFLSNTFIFALSGLIVQDRVTTINLSTEFTVFYALMSICTYAICSVVRIVVLAALFPLLKRMGYHLLKTEGTIMTFVGLRGAISLSLALLVERNADIPGHIRDIILLQVAGVVTLSLVINGSIVGVIYNRMNVYPENLHTSEVVDNALAALKQDAETTLDDLSQHWLHRRADMGLVRNLLPDVDKIVLSKAGLRWDIKSMSDAWDEHDEDLGKKTDEEIVEALKEAHVVDGDVEHDHLDHALLNHTLKKFSITFNGGSKDSVFTPMQAASQIEAVYSIVFKAIDAGFHIESNTHLISRKALGNLERAMEDGKELLRRDRVINDEGVDLDSLPMPLIVFWQSVQKHIFGSAASVDYDGSEVSLGETWDESQMAKSDELTRRISVDSTIMPEATNRDSVDDDGTQGLLEGTMPTIPDFMVPDDILRHGHLVHCMEMLYGIVTVFRDMRFLIDGCFHLSAPKEEHKLKLSMEYVWKAAFLTMGHLYGRYPRLLVGVHSVLAARSAYYALGAQIKNYSEAGLLPAQFNQTTHMMFTSRLYLVNHHFSAHGLGWIGDRLKRQFARTCGKANLANQDVVGRVQVIKAVSNPLQSEKAED